MKKMMKKIALAVACVTTVAMFAACGGKDDKDVASNEKEEKVTVITFGTNAEFPPFEFVSANGVIDQYDGIDMAIAKQIGDELGMTAKIENMEFDSLLLALQNGQVDAVIAGMTIDPERAEEVNFSVPYYTAKQVMIVKEASTIAKATDMADKKIVVIQGYTGESCVKDMGYAYEAFKKGSEAIMDSATAQKYVSDNEGLKIVEDAEAFSSEEYGIAVNKKNTELLEKINEVLNKMIADGTINELSAKYSEQ